MDYIISASTDIGIKKDTNQDGLLVKSFNTKYGKMVFAVLCDGMGGLAKGEIASSETTRAFDDWFCRSLPSLLSEKIEDSLIRQQWSDIVRIQNERIKKYSNSLNLNMGTTVVAGLFTQNRIFVMNVGDSRAYEIKFGVRQITKDHTVVNDEVEKGILTPEQAKNDPRRNVLLQCIGASENVYPGFYFEEAKSDAVYMLCSDGFIHEITENEIFNVMKPANKFNTGKLAEADYGSETTVLNGYNSDETTVLANGYSEETTVLANSYNEETTVLSYNYAENNFNSKDQLANAGIVVEDEIIFVHSNERID